MCVYTITKYISAKTQFKKLNPFKNPIDLKRLTPLRPAIQSLYKMPSSTNIPHHHHRHPVFTNVTYLADESLTSSEKNILDLFKHTYDEWCTTDQITYIVHLKRTYHALCFLENNKELISQLIRKQVTIVEVNSTYEVRIMVHNLVYCPNDFIPSSEFEINDTPPSTAASYSEIDECIKKNIEKALELIDLPRGL